MKQLTIILFLFLTGHFFLLSGQLLVLTDSTQLSLLTCSPGPNAYEKFGHTAIRILDETQSVDVVANWGLFDFDEPGFYYKFVKGETYYNLGIHETFYFMESYRQRNSRVTEQILNLSKADKQRLLDAILINNLPENRKYLYNFVFDNCATRPRDMIAELFSGEKMQYNLEPQIKTYREWIAHYAGKNSWLMFGIDLVFGKDADAVAPRWETMFLPEVLSDEFGKVQVVRKGSISSEPLMGEKRIIVEKSDLEEKINPFPPFITMLILLFIGLIITFSEYKRKKHYKLFDSLLLFVTGLAGLIIFYLMFFSIHPLVKVNFNILWCMPLNLFVAVLVWIKSVGKIVKTYQILYIVLILTAFIIAVLSIQSFNVAFLLIMSLLLVRALYWLYFYKNKASF